MGVFTTVGRLFKPRQAKVNIHPDASGSNGHKPESASAGRGTPVAPGAAARTGTPPKPVAIDLHIEDDPDSELEGFDPGREPLPETKPPRSKQELIAELQRNYQEVLGIVRKVDMHLDEQGQRSGRMAEIAERFPAAAGDLAHLRARQDSVHETLEAVSRSLHERDETLAASQLVTNDRLEEIRGLMAESSESERQLIGSLVEFRDMMGGMRAATERLAEAVGRIESREHERVNEIVGAIKGIRSSVVAIGVVAAGCAVIAIAIGFVALVF